MVIARFVLFLLLCLPSFLYGQKDSTLAPMPSTKKVVCTSFPDSVFTFNTKHPVPKKAALYSALLPGLGQVYNKQYWKTGVVAVGAGVISYFIFSNRNDYLTYQKAYIDRRNNANDTTAFPNYSLDDLNLLRKGFRKYYEYSIISASVAYLINILDAYTSAHLKSFDMSKDISYHISPGNTNQPVSLRLSFTLK
jgi:hypothetical protein